MAKFLTYVRERMLEILNETICVFYKRGGLVEIDKIYFQKNNWYYSDGTAIKFVHHENSVLWKSHDGVIRLIDYSDKNEANEIQRLADIDKIPYQVALNKICDAFSVDIYGLILMTAILEK